MENQKNLGSDQALSSKDKIDEQPSLVADGVKEIEDGEKEIEEPNLTLALDFLGGIGVKENPIDLTEDGEESVGENLGSRFYPCRFCKQENPNSKGLGGHHQNGHKRERENEKNDKEVEKPIFPTYASLLNQQVNGPHIQLSVGGPITLGLPYNNHGVRPNPSQNLPDFFPLNAFAPAFKRPRGVAMTPHVPHPLPHHAHHPLHHHVPHHVHHPLPHHVPNHVPHHVPNHVPNLVPNHVPHHVPHHVPNLVPNHVPHHVPNLVPNHVPNHVPHHVPNLVPNHVPHHVPLANHVGTMSSPQIPNHISAFPRNPIWNGAGPSNNFVARDAYNPLKTPISNGASPSNVVRTTDGLPRNLIVSVKDFEKKIWGQDLSL